MERGRIVRGPEAVRLANAQAKDVSGLSHPEALRRLGELSRDQNFTEPRSEVFRLKDIDVAPYVAHALEKAVSTIRRD
jgi:hypothetical protein